jgi:hypothetical protein
MKGFRALLIVPCLLLAAGAALAREASVQVELVQAPAWVERGESFAALV